MRITKPDQPYDVNWSTGVISVTITVDAATGGTPLTQQRTSRPSTQADVARLAGVSVATVSYVANGRRPDRKIAATPEVAERVREAMRQLDYSPRRAGRVLARNRTDLVAVVASTFNPWSLDLITEIEEAAAERGLGLIILRYGHTGEAIDRVESLLVDGLADAALILGSSGFSAARAHRIGSRIPTLITGEWYRPRRFDVMVQHEAEAVRTAAEYLIRHKVRRPAFLAEPVDQSRHRSVAFATTFRQHGFPDSAITIADQPPGLSGFLESRSRATELLDQPRSRRPDAILAHSDRAAISAAWAAMQLGIRVPDELKIIGIGNIVEGTEINPALTTIGTDTSAYRPMLHRLFDRIDTPDQPTRTIAVPWRLIIRGTA
ncbi:LacI family DNA-binding transcriptional regulator [Microlunatus speluncae]|uniref:LacI family DNA-binding transcriptional regulator n=1 Tax=Microlunatus speluncae TaxID=2594267 RepID=UPI001376106D|nr:LacI family DNA-binding transcriptional regulator [Microlunatus speluncae]